MQLEQLAAKIGFGQAVVVMERRLEAQFWKKLDFEQWKQVCEAAAEGSHLRTTAQLKMVELTQSFAQAGECYRLAAHGGEIETVAFFLMRHLAESFDDMLTSYNRTRPDSVEREDSLGLMNQYARQFEQLKAVYVMSGGGSPLRQGLLTKMQNAAANVEQWMDVYLFATENCPLRRKVGEKLKAFTAFRELQMICDRLPIDCEERRLALHQLVLAANTFERLVIADNLVAREAVDIMSAIGGTDIPELYLGTRRDDLPALPGRKEIWLRMKALAREFDDWYALFLRVPPEDPLRVTAEWEMRQVAVSFEQVLTVFDCDREDSPLRVSTLEKLYGLAGSFDQHAAVLMRAMQFSDLAMFTRAKMFDLVETFEQGEELLLFTPGTSGLRDSILRLMLDKAVNRTHFSRFIELAPTASPLAEEARDRLEAM